MDAIGFLQDPQPVYFPVPAVAYSINRELHALLVTSGKQKLTWPVSSTPAATATTERFLILSIPAESVKSRHASKGRRRRKFPLQVAVN